jgi:hypothetical protein
VRGTRIKGCWIDIFIVEKLKLVPVKGMQYNMNEIPICDRLKDKIKRQASCK